MSLWPFGSSSGCGNHHYGEWTETASREYRIDTVGLTAAKPYVVVVEHSRQCLHAGCSETEVEFRPISSNRWKVPRKARSELAGYLLGIDDADDLSRFVNDAANVDAGTDEYTRAAMLNGRPRYDCECDECECMLHSYDRDGICVWCRNGTHRGDESE